MRVPPARLITRHFFGARSEIHKKAGGATPPAPKHPLAVRKRTVPDTRATKYQPIWAMCANSCELQPSPRFSRPPPRGPQEERARVSQGNFHYIERYDILPGDVNRDRCVDDSDLLRVLFAFGQTGSGLPEDLNGDNTVDDADLLTVLFNFGSGCE